MNVKVAAGRPMTEKTDIEIEAHHDQVFMRRAYDLATQAAESGEVPVGAVLVQEGQVIAEAYNQCISNNDPTGHAEVQVLRSAAATLENYRLLGTTLYVTIEPCTMCYGAMVHARIQRLVFGAEELKGGVINSNLELNQSAHFNHKIQVSGGIMADEIKILMQEFFKARRN